MGRDEVVESCVLHLEKTLQKGGEALILQQRGGGRSPQVTTTTFSDGEFPGRVFIDGSLSWLRDSSHSGDSEGGMRGLEALCVCLVMDLQGNPAACLEGGRSDPRIPRDSSSTQKYQAESRAVNNQELSHPPFLHHLPRRDGPDHILAGTGLVLSLTPKDLAL